MLGTPVSSGHFGSTDSTICAPSLSRSTAFTSASIRSVIALSLAACFTMYSRTMPMRMPASGFAPLGLVKLA
jgi:hypothetical protein